MKLKSTLAVLAIVTSVITAGGAQVAARGNDGETAAVTEEACPLDPRAWDADSQRARASSKSNRWDDDAAFGSNERNPGAIAAARNCTWCHGNSAQGYAIAPRLAGQNRAYIESQLMRFREKLRNNPYSQRYMWHTAAKVSPHTVAEIAEYFATIPPEPANNGDDALVPAGRALYESGLPSANIVACSFCHGPNAQGVGRIPRLGGQSYPYLKRRLEQWTEGYSPSSEHMPGVAAQLSPGQIDALASYLSFAK